MRLFHFKIGTIWSQLNVIHAPVLNLPQSLTLWKWLALLINVQSNLKSLYLWSLLCEGAVDATLFLSSYKVRSIRGLYTSSGFCQQLQTYCKTQCMFCVCLLHKVLNFYISVIHLEQRYICRQLHILLHC